MTFCAPTPTRLGRLLSASHTPCFRLSHCAGSLTLIPHQPPSFVWALVLKLHLLFCLLATLWRPPRIRGPPTAPSLAVAACLDTVSTFQGCPGWRVQVSSSGTQEAWGHGWPQVPGRGVCVALFPIPPKPHPASFSTEFRPGMASASAFLLVSNFLSEMALPAMMKSPAHVPS